ncbi:MAG TPA: alcohol dehydrogenase [Rhodopirellula sp.]|nr:alcohol dehydrogenase [Rhodopirellula sp.]
MCCKTKSVSDPNWGQRGSVFALTVGIFLATSCARTCFGADWPRFRGPDNNGVSQETDWNADWGNEAPPIDWRFDVGTGYSSVVIANGRLYTLGNQQNVDTVYCLEAQTGKLMWSHSYECATDPNEFEGGPTATPTVADGELFTLSRVGDLFCFDAGSGEVKWRINVPAVTSIRTPGWGFSGAPWVAEGLVVVNVGDAGVALSIKDGSVSWVSADKDSGYSSFVPLQQEGQDCLIFGSARSYVCVDARTGAERWRQRWLTTFGCNATNPIVVDEKVFLSSGYNRGSALLSLEDGVPVLVWKTKEFQNQLSSGIYFDGLLYGANGSVSEGATLACLNLQDGKVLWNAADEKIGGLAAAGKYLITISDEGTLKIIEPNQLGPRIVSQLRVFEEQCWTVPVLCDGRIYCRGARGALVCVNVQSTD